MSLAVPHQNRLHEHWLWPGDLLGRESKRSGRAFRGGGFRFSYLMLGTKASGAQVSTFRLAINEDGGRVNIGSPASVGVALGVTNIMTELR